MTMKNFLPTMTTSYIRFISDPGYYRAARERTSLKIYLISSAKRGWQIYGSVLVRQDSSKLRSKTMFSLIFGLISYSFMATSPFIAFIGDEST